MALQISASFHSLEQNILDTIMVDKIPESTIFFSEEDVMRVAEKIQETTIQYDQLFKNMGKQIISDISRLDDPTEIMSICLRHVDKAIKAFQKHIPEPKDIACKKGCCHCCSLPVECPPPVLQAIAAYIKKQISMEEQEVLYEKMAQHVIQTKIGSKRSACPFLNKKNSCIIYHKRPLSCRAFTSPDAQMCKQSVSDGTNIPQQAISYRIYQIATTALLHNAQNQGRPHLQVAFIPTLLSALRPGIFHTLEK